MSDNDPTELDELWDEPEREPSEADGPPEPEREPGDTEEQRIEEERTDQLAKRGMPLH